MPDIQDKEFPFFEIKALHHVLLPDAVSYDVQMDPHSNFFFLTGANMAGKSTFIKSVGSALFLAHLGMGVPADQMKISLFDGILSNINVVDNLVKGESYFFNEVQTDTQYDHPDQRQEENGWCSSMNYLKVPMCRMP